MAVLQDLWRASEVAAQCESKSDCKAFDMEPDDNCGYLKSAQGADVMVAKTGYSVYCRLGAGSCTGVYVSCLVTVFVYVVTDIALADDSHKRHSD